MNKLFIICIFSICQSIGIDALGLPSSAQSLAISNTGIALPINSYINSSFQSDNLVSFSSNYWFEGVSGKTITNRFGKGKHEVSINSFGIKDLALWGETPDKESLGTFGMQFASLSYGYLLKKSDSQSFGIKVKTIYSKLYVDHMYGLLFDGGLRQRFTKNLNFGLSLKNIGHIQTYLAIHSIPSEYGLGLSYDLQKFKSTLLLDIVYNNIQKEVYKLGCITNFKYVNIYGSFNQFKSNRYISTGMQIKYKNFAFTYGILFQKVKLLGIPQSFQLTLYY